MAKKYKNKYRIEPNRWQYWDYSSPASYFITIVTVDRNHIFGKIDDGKMILSEYGKIVENEFCKMGNYHNRANVDEYIIMPNHVHCIITLSEYEKNVVGIVDKINNGIVDDEEKIHEFSLSTPQSITVIKQNRKLSDDEIKQYRRLRRNMVLVKMLGKFQQQTSKHINIYRNTPGTTNWQHDYHDHVIRNDGEYQRIRNYIVNNPQKWEEDKFM